MISEYQLVLGFFILALLKWKRFGTPSWVRSYTTAGKYYLGQAAYLVFAGFLYLLLVAVAWRLTTRENPELGLIPLLILFILLLLLQFRPLSSLEGWFRKRLYDLIGYPIEAYRLTEVMFRSKHSAPKPIEMEVKSLLQSRGYDPDKTWLPMEDPMRELWLKAAILFRLVRGWEGNKRYRGFLSNARVEFDGLRLRFDQLSFKVPRIFETVERFGILLSATQGAAPSASSPDSADPSGRTEVQESIEKTVKATIDGLISDLREEVDFFLRNVCLFIARGVLSNTLTYKSCKRSLEELGFEVQESRPTPMSVLLKAAVIFMIGLAIPVAMSNLDTEEHFPFRTGMIATLQVIALATAIFPKRRYGFANEDIYGHPPWAFILGAGGFAVVLAGLVGLGFRALAFKNWNAALNDFFCNLPWLLMVFSTTAVSAFLIQDSRWASTASLRAKRMRDAAVMASIMIITTAIVLVIFQLVQTHTSCDMASLLEHKYMIVATTGIIGFLIGYLVPSAFRDQGLPRRNAGQTAETS